MKLAVHGMGTANAFDLCPGGMDQNYGMDGTDFAFPGGLTGSGPDDGDIPYVFKADTSSLADFVPKGKLRRIDHYSRMALLACGRALKDTDPSLFSRGKTGVILATGYGAFSSTVSFWDSYIEKGDKLAFPTHFSNSVSNAAAAYISILYDIEGPSLTVSQFDLAFFSALVTAGAWLETGKTDAVLIGTTDAYNQVLGYCIGQFASPGKSISYSFGEGAAFFLVTRESQTSPKYGVIDQITMGKTRNLAIPLGVDILVSPSSTDICAGMPKEWGAGGRNIKVRSCGFSPTDSGMDVAYAMAEKKKTCCIKLGQKNGCGSVIITPAEKGNK